MKRVIPVSSDEKASVLKYLGFTMEYQVRPENVKDKIISVSIRIYPNGQEAVENFSLGQGSIEVLEPKCTDENGDKVDAAAEDGLINIGPISKDVNYVDYIYKVKIGGIVNGKAQGEMYEDLLVFSGENVLLFPYFSPLSENDMKSIDSYIGRIKVNADVNPQWNGIMPYKKNSGSTGDNLIEIVKELSEYNKMLEALYRNQVPSYPYDPVALLKTNVILKEAENRKLAFASNEIQKMVRDYSETIYVMLMQMH